MNINIELSKKEVDFLQQFATKQYEGAPSNVGTRTPIHVVERRCAEFVADDSGEVWLDYDNGEKYKCFDHLIEARNEQGESLPKYEDVEYGDANDVFVCDENDYIKAYELNVGSGRIVESYQPVAFFFIRDEAVRYMNDYQKHNCGDCRIYTYGLGYSNQGDLPVFRELLMRIGTQIFKSEKE